MELTKRPFYYATPGWLLTIGGHSMHLLREDLRELSRLVNAALEEESPPSIAEQLMQGDAPVKERFPLASRLKSMAVGDTLALTVADAYQVESIRATCYKMKQKSGLVFRTTSDLQAGRMVICRVE